MKKLLPTLRIASLFFLFSSFSYAQVTLVSEFEFNGNLNDNLANGTCVSQNNTSLTYAGSICSWACDSVNNKGGFKVSIPDAVFTESNYSIALEFQLSRVSGYNKFLDFLQRGSDQGVYFNSQMRLYSIGNYGSTNIIPDSMYTVLITRESANDSVKSYFIKNGNLSAESVGSDVAQSFVAGLSGTDRVIHFFSDDSLTQSEYSPRGKVERIRIWNGKATISDMIIGVKESTSTAKEIFSLFPNPSEETISIRFSAPQKGNLRIVDALGKEMYTAELKNESLYKADISALSPGIYFVHINGSVQRLVKN